MPYSRIVQYGNVTELYQYEKDLHPKKQQNHYKIQKLLTPKVKICPTLTLKKKRQENMRTLRKKTGTYTQSDNSKKRTLKNFFRLCHHNNVLAKSIHFLTLTFAYDLTYAKAQRAQSVFMAKITTLAPEVSISYISVPELTKANRWHFHLLIYDLPTRLALITLRIKVLSWKSHK